MSNTNVSINFWVDTDSEDASDRQTDNHQDADLFSVRQEDVSKDTAKLIAQYYQFKGDVRASDSGKSWICYKEPLVNGSVEFDLSLLKASNDVPF